MSVLYIAANKVVNSG